jgi:hypothetical protein
MVSIANNIAAWSGEPLCITAIENEKTDLLWKFSRKSNWLSTTLRKSEKSTLLQFDRFCHGCHVSDHRITWDIVDIPIRKTVTALIESDKLKPVNKLLKQPLPCGRSPLIFDVIAPVGCFQNLYTVAKAAPS